MPTEPMRVFRDGVLVETVDIEISQESANERTLLGQADAALANNATFLSINNPTNAQVVAQVKDLTRQNSKIIRLILQRFDAAE